MKICIIIPDGVGVRNYLYSSLIDELNDYKTEIIIWHSISEDAINEVKKAHANVNLEFFKLPKFIETKKQLFYRELICYLRLLYNSKLVDNKSILDNWKIQETISKIVFYKIIEIIAKFKSKKYSQILKYEEIYEKLILKRTFNNYKSFLSEHKIDRVFCTNQRSIQAIPVVIAAKFLNIPTIGAIFSWDNLPKARLNARTDKFIVWSKHMKNEMKLFYEEFDDNLIEVTGTPQFEFYFKKELFWSKQTFCDKFRFDSSKKIICFSGDDVLTSPHDQKYLEDIVKAISNMHESLRPQLLFRRCPTNLSDRYDSVLKKYSKIIKVADPIWNINKGDKIDWSSIYPKLEDVELLVNISLHCDVVINVGSTMALDFYVNDKPAIFINYDTLKSEKWSVKTIYKFQHFKSMPSKKSVIWLNNKNDISDIIMNSFGNKNNFYNKKWLNIIAENRNDSSKKIADILSK